MATKKINAKLDDYFNIFKAETEKLYNNVSGFEKELIKNNEKAKEYCFKFIYNKINYSLHVWYANDGISCNVAYGNNKEKQTILSSIIENTNSYFGEETKTSAYSFKNIPIEIIEQLKIDFNIDKYKTETISDNSFKIKFEDVYLITITYYSTKTLLLQGKTNPLWNDVFFYLSEKLNLKSTDIVSKYIKTNNELNGTKIEIDNDLILNNLQDKLGIDLLKNRKIILTSEVELLKTTEQFLSLNINANDYSFMLCPVFRVIEGILRRLLSNYNLFNQEEKEQRSFYQFHTKGNRLAIEYEQKLSNNKEIIDILNELYSIYCVSRNRYLHSDGFNPLIIKTKNDALAIFEEICTLLKKIQSMVEYNIVKH